MRQIGKRHTRRPSGRDKGRASGNSGFEGTVSLHIFSVDSSSVAHQEYSGCLSSIACRNAEESPVGEDGSEKGSQRKWEWNGATHPISEWARQYGITKSAMRQRLLQFGSPEKNLSKVEAYQANRAKRYEWNGEAHTIKEWAQKFQIPERTMCTFWQKYNSPVPPEGSYVPRTGRLWEWNGEKHTVKEWSAILGFSPSAVRRHLEVTGKPNAPTIEERRANGTLPSRCQPYLYTWNGITKTAKEWGEEFKCSGKAIVERFRRHGSPLRETPHPPRSTVPHRTRPLVADTDTQPSLEKVEQVPTPAPTSQQSLPIAEEIVYTQPDPPKASPADEETEAMYGYDGIWQPLDKWASDYGLSVDECSQNFLMYGQPMAPSSEDGIPGDDTADGTPSKEETLIDEYISRWEATDKIRKPKSSILEELEKIKNRPDNNMPLRDSLGVVDNYHTLDWLAS